MEDRRRFFLTCQLITFLTNIDMNATQYYMTKAGYGTPESSQSLALKPQPMDFSQVPAPQIVNGVIQTDLPHQPSGYSTGSYFDPQE